MPLSRLLTRHAATSTLVLLTALLSVAGCTYFSSRFSSRDRVASWNAGQTAPRPLLVTETRDASGRLLLVRLDAVLHAYAGDRGEDGTTRPVPPTHRDLKILIRAEIDAPSLRAGSPGARLHLELWKLSPRLYGPRIHHDPTLRVRTDDARFEAPATSRVESDEELYLETVTVELPLGTVIDLAFASSHQLRLASLSPFSLDADTLETLREFGRSLDEEGISLDRLPRLERAPMRDEWLGSGGSIWGIRFNDPRLSRVVQISSYPGTRAEVYSLRPTSWVRFPDRRVGEPLVARLVGRESDVALDLPSPVEADSTRAWQMAALAHETVREEFELEEPPDLWVLVFPIEEDAAVQTIVTTPLGRGVGFGVPSLDGQIGDATASRLLWLMTHETTEGLLILPYLGASSRLYARSRNCRWIGDGLAELLAALAHRRARDDGHVLPPAGDDLEWLASERRRGVDSVELASWLTLPSSDAPEQESGGEPAREAETIGGAKTRYLAAEELAHRFYESARARGHEHPVAAFVASIRTLPDGPSYDQAIDALAELSGLDIRSAARRVPIENIVSYHVAKWRELGWRVPRRLLR